MTQTAFERTAGIDSSAAILITGAGAIGTALADVLRPLHDRVDVYDTRSGCMTPIDLPNAIGGYDVIIGATGATSVPASMHELLRPGVLLMSASSSDREFDAVALRRRTTPNPDCHADLRVADGSVDATLLNSGFPVNFDGSPMCGDASMALTMALLAAAVLYASVAVADEMSSDHPHLGLIDQGDIVASFLNIDVPLQALSRLPVLSIDGYRRLQVRSGYTLFRQGERADHFFVIESGELEALVDGKVILRLGAGDHFGEACLLGGMRRIATVRACEPSVLWELDGKAFGDALHGDAAMREIAYGVARTRLMHAGASESLMV